jgi:hypothetical protein
VVHATRHSSSRKDRRGAKLETVRLRIAHSELGRELIAELSAFEVNYPPHGNPIVEVHSKDRHADLVVATALALCSAVGHPSGRIQLLVTPRSRRHVSSEPGQEATRRVPGQGPIPVDRAAPNADRLS